MKAQDSGQTEWDLGWVFALHAESGFVKTMNPDRPAERKRDSSLTLRMTWVLDRRGRGILR